MSAYQSGDVVACKLGYGKIQLRNSTDFEIIKEFDILCPEDSGYLILVPSYLYLHNSFIITKKDCSKLKIQSKFQNSTVCFITEEHIINLRQRFSGLFCAECNDYFEHAEINRLDQNGKGILICWRCRQYPFYS